MTRKFLFLVTLPQGCRETGMLRGLPEGFAPMVDLDSIPPSERASFAEHCGASGIPGITLAFSPSDEETLAAVASCLPGGGRVVLRGENADAIPMFRGKGIAVGREVGGLAEARQAVKDGADFLVIQGSESGGAVSSKTSLILVQELAGRVGRPLVVRGSLGPLAAAGAFSAGCDGCILDSQLLLAGESPVPESLKKRLASASPLDARLVGDLVGRPRRYLASGDPRTVFELAAAERAAVLGNDLPEDRAEAFLEALGDRGARGFVEGESFLPVGQGLFFAQGFSRRGFSLQRILREYAEALDAVPEKLAKAYPFAEGSDFARERRIRYPIVQGPMSPVSADSALSRAVSRSGGLPFIARSVRSPERTRRAVAEVREEGNGAPVGVGIIGFSPIDDNGDQVDAVGEIAPDCLIIAGGDASLASRFRGTGVVTFAHAPAPAAMESMAKAGVDGLVLEGNEAGGHVGGLCSLVLWESCVSVLRDNGGGEGFRSEGFSVILAGGLANARGSILAAAVATGLEDLGVRTGLQIGTAYMLTREAAELGVVSRELQAALFEADETAVTGRAMNLPGRWARNGDLVSVLAIEDRLAGGDAPIAERKALYERGSLDLWHSALKGTGSRLLMCGQSVALRSEAVGIEELHGELCTEAARIAGENASSGARAWGAAGTDSLEGAVAIVGMGGIFPDADDIAGFWENIVNGVSSIREVPKELWDPELHWVPERGVFGKTYSKIGGFVEGFAKDPVKFRMPPASAAAISRSTFMLLEAVHQALADSGYDTKEFPRKTTGVYMGAGTTGPNDLSVDYSAYALWPEFVEALKDTEGLSEILAESGDEILESLKNRFWKDMTPIGEDSCPGLCRYLDAGWISSRFDLGGGTTVTDMACASSLAAVDAAVTALRLGRIDMAVAGGCSELRTPVTFLLYSSLGALSGKASRPLDRAADGFVLGEGAGAVILKRLEDALRDGDRIDAVIRNAGISSDGKGRGITAPKSEGQVRALEKAYEGMPFGPGDISLIETHGTGTPVGDQEEMKTLREFFEKRHGCSGIAIGSVKSMIGHLRAGAGIASLIKATLALRHGILPPTANCDDPIEGAGGGNEPFRVLREAEPWPRGRGPRRVAVEAFGFGGGNAHVIVEEAPRADGGRPANPGSEASEAYAFVISGDRRGDLAERIRGFRGSVVSGEDLRELAWRNARAHGRMTAVFVGEDREELAALADRAEVLASDPTIDEFSSAKGLYYCAKPLEDGEKVAFLYPGQGAQYEGMAGDLSVRFPVFGDIVSVVDDRITAAGSDGTAGILQTVPPSNPGNSEIRRKKLTEVRRNHPAMLEFTAGLTGLLEKAGVVPDATAGHSLGEYAALYASGVIDIDTAAEVINDRANRFDYVEGDRGAMASVSASPDIVEGVLKGIGGVISVANKNCPSQTVVSGETASVEEALRVFGRRGYDAVRLEVSHAFHSDVLRPIVAGYRSHLDAMHFSSPRIPVQSNVLGSAYAVDADFENTIRDLLAEHLASPVEFTRNVESLYESGVRFFVEVGPGGTLSSFVDNILGNRPHWTAITNHPKRPASFQVLHALAICASKGLPVDFRNIMEPPPPIPLFGDRGRGAAAQSPSRPDLRVSDGGSGNLPAEFLAGEDAERVRRYLSARMPFIREMVRVDFRYFEGIPANIPESGGDDGPLGKGPAGEAAKSGGGGTELEARVIEIVSEKTGYPADVLDPDLDIEVELGLDSIKQVELLKAVSTEFGKDFTDFRITTLRDLIDALPDDDVGRDGDSQAPLDASGPEAGASGDFRTANDRWFCRPAPMPSPSTVGVEGLEGRTIAVLAGKDGPSAELAAALEGLMADAGAEVSTIRPGEPPAALPNGTDTVVDARFFGADDSEAIRNPAAWWKHFEAEAAETLALGRSLALAADSPERSADTLAWMTIASLGGSLGALGVRTFAAGPGPSLAMGRILEVEHSGKVRRHALDFDVPGDPGSAARAAAAELAAGRAYPEIGYVGGVRHEIRWEKGEGPDGGGKVPLDRDSLVVAVGGATGVTFEHCLGIAMDHGCRFVLLGRSAVDESGESPLEEYEEARARLIGEARDEKNQLTPAEIDRRARAAAKASERILNIGKLREHASSVSYVRCDVGDPSAVRSVLGDCSPGGKGIDLLIHGAVEERWKKLVDCDAADFTALMKARVLGLANLIAPPEVPRIKALLNISSLAAYLPTEGQAAYCAGHNAASLVASGLCGPEDRPWTNLMYGTWLNTGVAGVGNVTERVAEKGLSFIRKEDGRAFVRKEIAGGLRAGVVYSGDSPLSHPEPKPTPLLDSCEIIGEGTAEGRMVLHPYGDSIVAEHIIHDEHPIVPGVASLEMIAETARTLVREADLAGIDDIAFPQAARFPRAEPREFFARVEIVGGAEGAAGGEVPGETVCVGKMYSVFSPPSGGEPQEIVHARCRLVFGVLPPPERPRLRYTLNGIGGRWVDAGPLWDTKAMEHRRGRFRNVSSFLSITRDGAVARVSGKSEFAESSVLRSLFLLDAASFISSLALSISGLPSRQLFTGVESVRFFDGVVDLESAPVRVVYRNPGDGKNIRDAEIFDADGNVAIRLLGLEGSLQGGKGQDLAYDEPIWDDVRKNPFVRELAAALGCDSGMEIGETEIAEVEPDQVEKYLSEGEKERFGAIPNATRRNEWFAGRMAAKDAIRRHLGENAPAYGGIDIGNRDDRAPYVLLDGSGAGVPGISISHSSGKAVAAVSDGPVGIDVEAVSDSILEIVGEFAVDGEPAALGADSDLEDAEIATLLWAAKEAVRKAVGTDAAGPRDWVLAGIEKHGDFSVLTIRSEDSAAVRCAVFLRDGYAYALCRPVDTGTVGSAGGGPSLEGILEEFEVVVNLSEPMGNGTLEFGTDLNVSSSDLLRILSRIEARYGFRFSPEDFLNIATVGDVLELAVSRSSGGPSAEGRERSGSESGKAFAAEVPRTTRKGLKASILRRIDGVVSRWTPARAAVGYGRLAFVGRAGRNSRVSEADIGAFFPWIPAGDRRLVSRRMNRYHAVRKGLMRWAEARRGAGLLDHTDVRGMDEVLRRHNQGSPSILVSLHMGYLYLLGDLLSGLGVPTILVRRLADYGNAPRDGLVSLGLSGPGGTKSMSAYVLRSAADGLRNGRTVVIAADGGFGESMENAAGSGIRFRLNRGPAALARETGALLVPVVVDWNAAEGRFVLEALPEIEPEELGPGSEYEADRRTTERLSAAFEGILRNKPEIFIGSKLKKILSSEPTGSGGE